MVVDFVRARESGSLPIFPIWSTDLQTAALPAAARTWAGASGFTAVPGSTLLFPDAKGGLAGALFGTSAPGENMLGFGALAKVLPAGDWHFEGTLQNPDMAALGMALGGYVFTRYGKMPGRGLRVALPDGTDEAALRRSIESTFLARDLINSPTNDMGPADLENAARVLARRYGADVAVIAGDALLEQGFPMIHAVGRASADAPRLIDMTWGMRSSRMVTLVGKGVCFDTGGLDIKPSSGMLLMKKDMGGAANVLGLASMIMAAKLDVRLRVLIPAVENSIAGNAFRPGDVLTSRKGLTVEIGNTDAEGRLILADALAFADEEQPEILIDMATLTGAARVALGPDLPPFYTGDDTLAAEISGASIEVEDPLWRMPLWKPYDAKLKSRIADMNNVTTDGFAGSITAALFLQRFVEKTSAWVHFDIFGWNPVDRPHSPAGGEAQGIRALESVITRRFGH